MNILQIVLGTVHTKNIQNNKFQVQLGQIVYVRTTILVFHAFSYL